ncbi:MAG: hypothetical protein M1820_004059 [Bogoriella megaspora]|nr:MAG: hypothetical protein M1820_004059 [Bogoriella megaspora]
MTKGGFNRNMHHCTECSKPVRARCITLGHVAPCEVPGCKGFFQVYKGCPIHPYSEGHNLEAQRKQRTRKGPHSQESGEINDAVDETPTVDGEEANNVAIGATDETAEDAAETARAAGTSNDTKEVTLAREKGDKKRAKDMMDIPAGGWNQGGLEAQPNGRKRKDKKNFWVAATDRQKKENDKQNRRRVSAP